MQHPGLTAVQIRESFEMFDTDGSGDIDAEELYNLLRQLAVPITRAQAKDVIETLDSDGNGTLDFQEFTDWFLALGAGSDEVEDADGESVAEDDLSEGSFDQGSERKAQATSRPSLLADSESVPLTDPFLLERARPINRKQKETISKYLSQIQVKPRVLREELRRKFPKPADTILSRLKSPTMPIDDTMKRLGHADAGAELEEQPAENLHQEPGFELQTKEEKKAEHSSPTMADKLTALKVSDSTRHPAATAAEEEEGEEEKKVPPDGEVQEGGGPTIRAADLLSNKGVAARMIKLKLKAIRTLNEVSGKTTKLLARRNLLGAVRVRARRENRSTYRKLHPPLFLCEACCQGFALWADYQFHRAHLCEGYDGEPEFFSRFQLKLLELLKAK